MCFFRTHSNWCFFTFTMSTSSRSYNSGSAHQLLEVWRSLPTETFNTSQNPKINQFLNLNPSEDRVGDFQANVKYWSQKCARNDDIKSFINVWCRVSVSFRTAPHHRWCGTDPMTVIPPFFLVQTKGLFDDAAWLIKSDFTWVRKTNPNTTEFILLHCCNIIVFRLLWYTKSRLVQIRVSVLTFSRFLKPTIMTTITY